MKIAWKQFETELGVLYVKLDNLSEDEENGNMVDVMTVLNGYERSVSTLMKTTFCIRYLISNPASSKYPDPERAPVESIKLSNQSNEGS